MKTKKIIKGILVLLMLGGCATNKKEEITPTPNITVPPTQEPTPVTTETPLVYEDLPQGEFDPNVWGIHGIEPITDMNYKTIFDYDINSEYYVVQKDGYYGVINDQNQMVINILSFDLPYIINKEMLAYESVIYDHPGMQNTDLRGQDGYGEISRINIFDEQTNKFNTMHLGHDGPSTMVDFEKYDYNNDILWSYQQVYNVVINEYGNAEYDLSEKKGVGKNDGEMVTDIIYDDVLFIESYLIPVCKDGLWGYVDINGNEVIECIYKPTFKSKYVYNEQTQETEIVGPYYPYPVIDDKIVVKNTDDKYGVIDKEGNTLIEFDYDYASPYIDGNYMVLKDGEWSIIE